MFGGIDVPSVHERFSKFFSAVNDGHQPFPWQLRLAEKVTTSGLWPDALDLPTGSGKSAVVEVHVFALAEYLLGRGKRVPRRLVSPVARRALSDSLHDRARRISEDMIGSQDPLVREMCDVLVGLSTQERSDANAGPITTVSLRGGAAVSSEWLAEPQACAVIAATPDMFGSRLLFRGYGSGLHARPREAGLLAIDSVVIVDEAHLSAQLVQTCRDVADLVRPAAESLKVPTMQVCASTATQAKLKPQPKDVVQLEAADRQSVLRDRLDKPKELTLVSSSSFKPSAKTLARYANRLADLCEELLQKLVDKLEQEKTPTVACVVNHRATAHAVAAELRKRHGQESLSDEPVVTLLGRMRPMDLVALQTERPGLFDSTGDPETRFLVATQTVEVGLDMDWGGLVTELAPGEALAQRAGRLNRLGTRDFAPCTVVTPESMPKDYLPYEIADLDNSLRWLDSLSKHAGDDQASIHSGQWVGVENESLTPPPSQMGRDALSMLTAAQAEVLADTSDEQFENVDLTLFVHDDLMSQDVSVGLCYRPLLVPEPVEDEDGKPQPTLLADVEADEVMASSRRAVLASPPVHDEVYPVDKSTGAAIVGAAIRSLASDENSHSYGFVWRDDELIPLREIRDDRRNSLRGGDVVVLSEDLSFVADQTVVKPGVLPGNATYTKPLDLALREGADLVEIQGNTLGGNLYSLLGKAFWTVSDSADMALAAKIVEPFAPSEESDHDGQDLEEPALAHTLLGSGWSLVEYGPEVTVSGEKGPAWMVFESTQAEPIDDDTILSVLPRGQRVTLADHSSDVAARAELMAQKCGLPATTVEVLRLAGQYHDAGKAHPLFQTEILLNQNLDVPLAKSRARSSLSWKKRRQQRRLPQRWRHEQLSAAIAVVELEGNDCVDLIVRLVGASHGRGRPVFEHPEPDLVVGHGDQYPGAGVLFGAGDRWVDIVQDTEREFSVWGCAYLESILRAADCQISAEGK